ncbi:ATP-binding protein [Kitasatospora sp. NPDC092286]|uniref:ATP-binding protein n=1 Tax=Kitasatospora sp. NPDC092286 TaxID=3364087 RepID=UPI003803F762
MPQTPHKLPTPTPAPNPSVSSSCWLPRSRRSPEGARRHLEKLLAGFPGGQRFAEDGLLLVSELVTNAVLHGTPVDNKIWLALDVNDLRLRIEVHDARGEREPVIRAATGADNESGRGLLLVKSLSQRWGCCPRFPIGKIVWCECAPTADRAEAVA